MLSTLAFLLFLSYNTFLGDEKVTRKEQLLKVRENYLKLKNESYAKDKALAIELTKNILNNSKILFDLIFADLIDQARNDTFFSVNNELSLTKENLEKTFNTLNSLEEDSHVWEFIPNKENLYFNNDDSIIFYLDEFIKLVNTEGLEVTFFDKEDQVEEHKLKNIENIKMVVGTELPVFNKEKLDELSLDDVKTLSKKL